VPLDQEPERPGRACCGGCRAGQRGDGDDDQAVVVLADAEGFLAGLWMPLQRAVSKARSPWLGDDVDDRQGARIRSGPTPMPRSTTVPGTAVAVEAVTRNPALRWACQPISSAAATPKVSAPLPITLAAFWWWYPAGRVVFVAPAW